MGDEPFFPPPKPRGDAYREAQERPLTAIVPSATPARVVVTRPGGPDSVRTNHEAELDAIIQNPGNEQSFWRKTSFVSNHPRLAGFLLLLPGVPFTLLTYEAARAHTRARGLAVGPLLLGIGLYLLVVGMPIDPVTGRPSARWQIGAVGAVLLGTVATLVAAALR